jgi:hypothetical protein
MISMEQMEAGAQTKKKLPLIVHSSQEWVEKDIAQFRKQRWTVLGIFGTILAAFGAATYYFSHPSI